VYVIHELLVALHEHVTTGVRSGNILTHTKTMTLRAGLARCKGTFIRKNWFRAKIEEMDSRDEPGRQNGQKGPRLQKTVPTTEEYGKR
jgi:hypothetical protein